MFHTRNSEIGNEKSYLVNFDLGHFCYRPCDLFFRLKVVVSHFKVCKMPVADATAVVRSFRFTLLKVERRCHLLFDEKHFSFALSSSPPPDILSPISSAGKVHFFSLHFIKVNRDEEDYFF